MLTVEELNNKIRNWIYQQQLKSKKESNLLKTMEVSDKLDALGRDGFAKEIDIPAEDAVYAYDKANRMVYICACEYHNRECGNE